MDGWVLAFLPLLSYCCCCYFSYLTMDDPLSTLSLSLTVGWRFCSDDLTFLSTYGVRGEGEEEARAKETASTVRCGGGNPEAPRRAVGWGTDGAGDLTVASLLVNVTVASVVGGGWQRGPEASDGPSGAPHVTRPGHRPFPTVGLPPRERAWDSVVAVQWGRRPRTDGRDRVDRTPRGELG